MTNAVSTISTIAQKGGFSLAPQNLAEAMQFAEILSNSTIVPKDYQRNPGNVLVALQWGAEIGLAPLQAMQNIAVINGRPAVWGDSMLAIVKGSGLLVSIKEEVTETEATCTIQRKGEAPAVRTFSQADAQKANLWGKQGPWSQYPKRMMQMRARAWALRDVFPDVLRGVGIAEEVRDIPPAPEKNMGPVEVVQPQGDTKADQLKAKLLNKAVQEAIDKLNACTTCEELKQVAATYKGKFEGEAYQRMTEAYVAKYKALKESEKAQAETPAAGAPAAGATVSKMETVDPETGEVKEGETFTLTFAQVADQINKADSQDALDIAMDNIRFVKNDVQQQELYAMAEKKQEAFK